MDAAIPNRDHDIKHEGDDQDSSAVLISSSNFKFTAFPNLTSFTGIPWSVLWLVCLCVCARVCSVCVWGGGSWHCARSNAQYAHVQRRYEKIYTEERREGRSSMEIESPQWLTPGALLSGSPLYYYICVLIRLYMRRIIVYMR